jgi:hypothetical protein
MKNELVSSTCSRAFSRNLKNTDTFERLSLIPSTPVRVIQKVKTRIAARFRILTDWLLAWLLILFLRFIDKYIFIDGQSEKHVE